MTDLAAVQRTVRRCTAVVVAALGLVVFLVGPAETALYGLVIAWLGVTYVAGSLVLSPGATPEGDGVPEH